MRKVTVQIKDECQRFSVPKAEAWGELAEYLATKLAPGDIVALTGELGAGKTTFVQALAQTLGVKKTPASPTFALMRSYPIAKNKKINRLLHVDAYRIETEREILALDLDEELSAGKTVLIIEWPEKIRAWLKKKPVIAIEITG